MNLTAPKLPQLDKCISHRNWQSALAESFALLVTAQPGDVICLVGPSRSGKTRLIQQLSSLLAGENLFEQTGELPVVAVEASNTGPNGRFSTKAFVHKMLRAVKHPFYMDNGLDISSNVSSDRKAEHELRRALEVALQHRRSRYLFIDEAQHARYASRDSLAVMDSWKCLAREGQVVLVLVGAYPMLDIIRDSAHMVGRKREVHLSRYRSIDQDLQEFARIVRYYEGELAETCSLDCSLVGQLELLYFGSMGCIGLLRSWLLYAAALAHARGSAIDENILQSSMHSDADREVVLREISDGEHLLKSSSSSLKKRMSGAQKTGEKSKSAGSRRPFQRNPKRHKPGERKIDRKSNGKGGAEQ